MLRALCVRARGQRTLNGSIITSSMAHSPVIAWKEMLTIWVWSKADAGRILGIAIGGDTNQPAVPVPCKVTVFSFEGCGRFDVAGIDALTVTFMYALVEAGAR